MANLSMFIIGNQIPNVRAVYSALRAVYSALRAKEFKFLSHFLSGLPITVDAIA